MSIQGSEFFSRFDGGFFSQFPFMDGYFWTTEDPVYQGDDPMKTLTQEYVRSVFSNLESGKSDEFFRHVANNVTWTVMGTHPLAGTYHDRDLFIASTFTRLNRVLKEGVLLRVTGILVSGDAAAVELEALSTALNGKPFHNRYCWVCRFEKGTIVEVRAYLDSALVQNLLDENETSTSAG